MYNHILIPTDGSDLAYRGVEQGLSLARQLGSKVTIVTVTESFPLNGVSMGGEWVAGPPEYARYDEAQKQFAEGILSAAKNEAAKLGVDAKTLHVANQHPATGILEAAVAHDCDLIVMASHGRRGIQRLLLGSQTAEVLAHSHAAVLVVR